MKTGMMVLAATMVMGACATAHAQSRTEVKVTPGDMPHMFVVEFRIGDQKSQRRSGPKLVLHAGQEGHAQITTDKEEQTGVFYTAFVRETETGIEATTTIIFKTKGVETSNNSQTLIMLNRVMTPGVGS